ncbi:MAG TPA: hypothetical protein VMN60_08745 [Longimicrobiales bacterium]|nr:hypothetical protein [Longimicrobiales bacterium]
MDDETRVFLTDLSERLERHFARIDARFAAHEERADRLERVIQASRLEMRERFAAHEERADRLERDIEASRLEIRERLQSVDEQFRTLNARTDRFETRVEAALHIMTAELEGVKQHAQSIAAGIGDLTNRMKGVELGLDHLNGRVDTLADDMRQRFRLVHERLGNAA